MNKPYAAYKHSGVSAKGGCASGAEWLGEIPEHWSLERLKYWVTLVNEKEEESREHRLRIGFENIESKTGKLISPEEEVAFEGSGSSFQSSDVLFGKLRPYLAKVLLTEASGVCVNDLLVLRSNSEYVLPKFLFHRLLSKNFVDEVNSSAFGTKMPRASWDFIGNLRLPLPPLPEQRAIARYLDDKTKKIDTLIEKKQRLIELLKEQRTAIINQAVTKGIDLSVQMKDPGIEWLGEIPEHWEVKSLKYLGDAIIGITYSPDEMSSPEEGVLVLRASNIQESKMSFDDCVYVKKEIPQHLIVRIGDILICSRNGSANLIGKNVRIDETSAGMTFGTFMTVFRSKYWQYLHWFFNSSLFKSQSGHFSTSTINQLTTATLNSMKIALPLDEIEQANIVQHIFDLTNKLDAGVAKAEKEIQLLQEYRAALISEVVTGKIDVREKMQYKATEEEWLLAAEPKTEYRTTTQND